MRWRYLIVALAVIATVAVAAVVWPRACDDDRFRVEGDGFEIREVADGIEVLATSEDGFYVGALFWVLRIGDQEFTRSTYPESSLNTILFPISAEAADQLADGDPISVSYGDFGSLAGAAGTQDEAAKLRVSSRC